MGTVNFDALTPKQKIVAVAKDVIAKLDAKKIQAAHDGYVYPLDNSGDFSLRPTFDVVCCAIKSGRECHVCAMGAALISALDVQGLLDDCDKTPDVALDDGGDPMDLDSFYRIAQVLDGIFDDTTMGLMEAAYEKGAVGCHCDAVEDSDAVDRAE